eukprot:scaffold88473_cov60-Phaeocystis_antarctica.AAC.1
MHACCPSHRLLPPPVAIAALPVRLPLYLYHQSCSACVYFLTNPPTHLPTTYPPAYYFTVLLGGGGLVHTVRGTEDDRLKRGPAAVGTRYCRAAPPPSSGP